MGGTTQKAVPESPAPDAASPGADTPKGPSTIAGRVAPPDVSNGRGPAMSQMMKDYFDRLHAAVEECYAVAKEARAKGLDPELDVEILPAEDLAARVEAQVGVAGVAEDIRAVTKEIGNRELVSLEVARRVAAGRYGTFTSAEEAVDKAVRTGLSILTEGVLVAPLEGIAEVKIGDNSDGTNYVDVYFAGPIRAAGGTAQAMSVLIADVVRRERGIGAYQVTDAELERYKEEVPAYKQAANLQYTPGPAEIEAIVKNCPVCINGEGTERVEIAGNRDLPRVETNQIRGGAMLVLCEGMCLKAPKLQKHVAKLGLEGWDFLDLLVNKKKDDKEDEAKEEEVDPDALPEIPPSTKYIRDIIAGRPVFGHPSRPGGFRLRYGRSRTAGLASSAVHPAVMPLVDDFIAIGTQLKIERPGKGTIGSPCGTIDPPSVLLRSGDLIRLETPKKVQAAKPFITEILDLGELLMPFGEFSENNHILARSPWVNEWFEAELEHHLEHHEWPDDLPRPASLIRKDRQETLDATTAFQVAEATGLPLAPSHTAFWHDLSIEEVRELSDRVAAVADGCTFGPAADFREMDGCPEDRPDHDTLFIPADDRIKELITKLTFHHRNLGDRYEATRMGYTFLRSLGFDRDDAGRVIETERRRLLQGLDPSTLDRQYPSVDLVSRLSGVTQRPRGPFRIGARMGRPEKADARKMKPPPHVLFPLGTAGGSQRLVGDAAKSGQIKVEVGKRRCVQCRAETYRTFCEMCRGHAEVASDEPEEATLDLQGELRRAQENLGGIRIPKQIKGVVGMMSKHKTPEPLEKGILRALHGVYTFKDGTVRFDMSDGPLTHFRPKEIAVTPERLVELGYTHDVDGRPLERDDQLLELRVQDIVVPNACGDYLLACAKYVDDLMVRFYDMEPFFKAEKRDDLVGHLAGGLAPHTSGAIAVRIIGFTPSQVGWGHPYFHAGKRRNCLAGDSEVFVLNSPAPARRSLADIWEQAGGDEVVVDDAGTHAKAVHGLRVLAPDPESGIVQERQVTKVLRVPAPNHGLMIRTKSGRRVSCSPGHRLLAWDGTDIHKAEARTLTPGDRLLFARRTPAGQGSREHLDLLAIWWEGGSPIGTVVRGLGDWWATAIDTIGGLGRAAAAADVSTKDLDNFRRRDSVPLPVLKRMVAAAGDDGPDAVPDGVWLAVARDTTKMPRRIVLDDAFMRLVGYYLAEGHARTRDGSFHQVDFAAGEEAMAEDIQGCIRQAFGAEVAIHPTRVTLSGRLFYHLFVDVLGLGTRASDKRLSPLLGGLPPERVRPLLAAYFAGDGAVEAGRLHVTATSVHKGLLEDIGLQLSRFDIAYRIRFSRRVGGGAVAAHAAKTGRPPKEYDSWTLSIRSADAVAFAREVGFTLPRKQEVLDGAVHKLGRSRLKAASGDLVEDPVVSVEHVLLDHDWLYDLEVDEDHTYLLSDLLASSNCDGDEDAVFLLMDGLLNFSRSYVPDRRGGLMDLPLVLTTRLDPAEIDKEAHNVDTLSKYPLAFFEATTRHEHPKDVEAIMGMVAELVGTTLQYEGFGFSHDTPDISEGILMSSYKTIPDMMAKLVAQLDLANKIRAVDMKDVASRVIGSHFMPDLIGNLKAFSKQKVRCPACNTKYRRFPLAGRCLTDGCKGKLTLTVHEGSVRKYLQPAIDISRKYDVSHYTLQRILLAQKSIESLFNNDKVRKAKLDDFFGEDKTE